MKKTAAQDEPERRFMILVTRFCHPSCHPLRIQGDKWVTNRVFELFGKYC